MSSYNYSYNVLINRLEAFAAGHFLIRRFTHGQIDMSDQLQDDQYPFMHVTPDTIEPVQGAMNFGFHIMFADIPRDKEYKAEYQREVISDCIRLGQDLIAEVKNGLELFGFDVQLLETPTFEPFMEEQKNTVTGVAFTLKLSVPWDWSACDIPAIWSVGGASGSGGTGTGYGIELQTNGVDNVVQTKLNLVNGTNITITDLGNGSVSIDAAGGTVDYVSTEFNVNHTTTTGNQYVIGDRVWYNGNVYQCIANNDALLPTNTLYWQLVSVGNRLRQTPVDWNATSGDFQVLNKPTIPPAQVNSDWNAIGGVAEILNKPTIPAAQVNSDWNAVSGVAQILNKPFVPSTLDSLTDVNTPAPTNGQVLTFNTSTGQWIASTPTAGGSGTVTSVALTAPAAFNVSGSPVTTSGTLAITAAGNNTQYIDGSGALQTFPTIPPAQVNSDWNAVGGVAEILNKPTIPTTLDSLTDVNAPAPTANNVLYWNGSVWKNGEVPLDSLSNVTVPAPTNGQVLTYDTAISTWVAATPASGGGGLLHGTASGTDTYTVTIAGAGAYADGDAYLIRFPNGNTTGATLNINGQGAIPLYRNNDGALIGGDIWAGAEMLCIYNSTTPSFQCIGTSPNSLFAYVTNAEGSTTITKGQPVYAFGGTGDRLTVKLAYNTTDATSAQTVGMVVSTSIAPNQKGIIIVAGQLDNLNTLPTSTFADGDAIYLGATAGSITNVKPSAPNHLVYLGIVTTASPGNAGRMYVRIQNGYELQELHNVVATSPANNDYLYYDASTSLYRLRQLTASLITDSTTVGQNLVKLPNPSAVRFLRINADNTVTARTAAEMVTDLGITTSSTSILYQFANGDTLAAGATRFGSLFGGSANHNASDAVRRTPMITNGTLTRLYVMTSTAQPATGSLVCTVRKNSVDQALTITIAAGSAAGVFSDLVNSVSVVVGDQMGMKFVNNSTGVSAAILNNQVLLTI